MRRTAGAPAEKQAAHSRLDPSPLACESTSKRVKSAAPANQRRHPVVSAIYLVTEGLMQSPAPAPSKAVVATGWVLSVLPALLLIISGTMKLLGRPEVAEGFTELGYAPSIAFGLG